LQLRPQISKSCSIIAPTINVNQFSKLLVGLSPP
jgi:hypothetical protein